MEITPYLNGVHSLSEGLRSLKQFMKTQDDPFLMKEVVIKIHHGLETLFKDILFQRNPVFLFEDDITVKQIISSYQNFLSNDNSYLFDSPKTRTISPTEAVQRIKNLGISDGMGPKEFTTLKNSFDNLNSLRNQLQHFALTANPEFVIKTLGSLVPRSLRIIKQAYEKPPSRRGILLPHEPLPTMAALFEKRNIEDDLNSMYEDATSVIAELEAKFDALLLKAVQKFTKTRLTALHQSLHFRNKGWRLGEDLPEITLTGWMNEYLYPSLNATSQMYRFGKDSSTNKYDARYEISEPEILSGNREWPGNVVTKLNFSSSVSITVANPLKFFFIPEHEEYISLIRNPKITIDIKLEIVCNAIFNDDHYSIGDAIALNGQMKTSFESSIFGDPTDEPSILGTQISDLNLENTKVRGHSFVENMKTMLINLEMEIQTSEDVVFK